MDKAKSSSGQDSSEMSSGMQGVLRQLNFSNCNGFHQPDKAWISGEGNWFADALLFSACKLLPLNYDWRIQSSKTWPVIAT